MIDAAVWERIRKRTASCLVAGIDGCSHHVGAGGGDSFDFLLGRGEAFLVAAANIDRAGAFLARQLCNSEPDAARASKDAHSGPLTTPKENEGSLTKPKHIP